MPNILGHFWYQLFQLMFKFRACKGAPFLRTTALYVKTFIADSWITINNYWIYQFFMQLLDVMKCFFYSCVARFYIGLQVLVISWMHSFVQQTFWENVNLFLLVNDGNTFIKSVNCDINAFAVVLTKKSCTYWVYKGNH